MSSGEMWRPEVVSWDVLRAFPLPIVALDREGLVALWNPAAEELFGWSEEEVLGREIPIVPPDQRTAHRRLLAELRAGRWHRGVEIERVRKDGSRLSLGMWTAPVVDGSGELIGTVAALPDIGTMRRTEELLRIQTHALEAAANGILIVDREGVIVWANAAVEELTGYPPSELVGRHTRVLRSGVQGPELYADLWATILAGRRWQGTLVNRRKDGSLYHEDMTIAPIREPDGSITHFVAVKQNVSEKRRMEEALRRSEQRFRTLTESSPDWIWEIDEDGVYTYASPRVRDLLGYEPAEVIGRRPFDLMPTAEAPRIREIFRGHVERRQPFFGLENTNLHRDGTEVVLETSATPILDEAGRVRGYHGVGRDITRRKRLEEQLAQGHKMEAIGQLAGGIAHDFNNLLTAINGYSDLILESTGEGEPWRPDLLEIRRAGERAASLTQQLLAFSRRQIRELTVLRLDEIVAGIEKMLHRILGEDVLLEVRLDDDLPAVLADRTQLEQVILNLAINARDAMPEGGVLTLKTDRASMPAEDSDAEGPSTESRDAVRLTVRDTGVGMDEATQARIFEPFFSTKGSQGTGLGLSTVYGIVQQNGGSIVVTSRPGEGTTFEVLMPGHQGTETPRASEPADADLGRPLTGTILLIEDDEQVRELVRTCLARNGFSVVEAACAGDACRLAEHLGSEVDLILTDVVLPDQRGPELARRLRAQLPASRTLFMSGYLDARSATAGELQEADAPILRKPFTGAQLIHRVRQALAAESRREP
jgi:PAS domain S-box-containing protein